MRASVRVSGLSWVVDTILYLVKLGAQWRQLPHDFPRWKAVYDHLRRWNKKVYGNVRWMT
ncbi:MULTISPECIES: transposase [Methylococcus]|uniref:transposase n=1 Tax=Methylococcus TaxID=413 RepID=UPI003523DFAB